VIAAEELERAAATVRAALPATPQYEWPLLGERTGCEVWVKHENHTPIGSFKVRGGIVLMEHLRRERLEVPGVVTATRGNHGQSIAWSARRAGLQAVIVVPRGNNPEKNAAMRALGAELVEHGEDFDAAIPHARALGAERGLEFVGPFSRELVAGVGSYALELFAAVGELDAVYVPIGCGSGICGTIAARDALGLSTEIVGVVSAHADAYARSYAAGAVVETPCARTMADGMAVRVPVPEALETILRRAARVVTVSDDQVEAAMRHLWTDTHNVAEGAGAAALAALLAEGEPGRRVGIVLSGGNVDTAVLARVLGDGAVA
jgi:threonine dehydratase